MQELNQGSVEERVEELISTQLTNITSGFPARDVNDFEKLIIELHHKGVSFIPIAVTKEGNIHMLTALIEPNSSRNPNLQILQKLDDPRAETVNFFASLQGVSHQRSERYANIVLGENSFVHVGFVNEPDFEVSPKLSTGERINILRPVFEAVRGVKFEPPK